MCAPLCCASTAGGVTEEEGSRCCVTGHNAHVRTAGERRLVRKSACGTYSKAERMPPPRSRRRLPSPPQRGACRCDSRSCGAVWMLDGRLVDTNTVVLMTFCVMQSASVAAGYDHTACADSLGLACRHHSRAELYLYYGNPVRLCSVSVYFYAWGSWVKTDRVFRAADVRAESAATYVWFTQAMECCGPSVWSPHDSRSLSL